MTKNPQHILVEFIRLSETLDRVMENEPKGKDINKPYAQQWYRTIYQPTVKSYNRKLDQLYNSIGKPNNIDKVAFTHIVMDAVEKTGDPANKENASKKLTSLLEKSKQLWLTGYYKTPRMTNAKLGKMSRGI